MKFRLDKYLSLDGGEAERRVLANGCHWIEGRETGVFGKYLLKSFWQMTFRLDHKLSLDAGEAERRVLANDF